MTANDETERPDSPNEDHGEESQIFAIKRKGSKWSLSRRSAIASTVAGASIAGCSDDKMVPVSSTVASSASPNLTSNPEPVGPIAHTKAITDLKKTPDGEFLVSASEDETVKIWKLPQGHLQSTLDLTSGAQRLAISSNGKFLAVAETSGTVTVFTMPGGQSVASPRFRGTIQALHVTDDGNQVFAKVNDSIVYWDSQKAIPTAGISLGFVQWHAFVVSPQAAYSVSQSNNEVRIVLLDSTFNKTTIDDVPRNIKEACVSPDGTEIAFGFNDRSLRLYSLDGQLLYEQSNKILTGLNYRNAQTLDALSGDDSSGYHRASYRVNKWAFIAKVAAHNEKIFDLAISPSEGLAATASLDRSVKLWNVDDWSLVSELPHSEQVMSVEFQDDESHLFTGQADGQVNTWKLSSGTQNLLSPTGSDRHTGGVTQVVTADDTVWTCGVDEMIKVWSAGSGNDALRLAKSFSGKSSRLYCADVYPPDRLIATGSFEGDIRLWWYQTVMERKKINAHKAAVFALKFYDGGKRIVSAGRDSMIRVWNAETGRLVTEMTGHTKSVFCVVPDPHRGWLFSCGEDGTVRIWNLENGDHLKTLTTNSALLDVRLIGRNRLAATGESGEIYLWQLPGILDLNPESEQPSEEQTEEAIGGRIVTHRTQMQTHSEPRFSRTEPVQSAPTGNARRDPNSKTTTVQHFQMVDQHNAVVVAEDKNLTMHSLDEKEKSEKVVLSDVVAIRAEEKRREDERMALEKRRLQERTLAEAKRKREQKAREINNAPSTHRRRATYNRPVPRSYGSHYWRPN